MKRIRFLLIPGDGGLHPVDAQLAAEPGVTRRAIHHLNLLEDDTAVTLYELTGDAGRVEAIVRDHPDVLSYNLTVPARSSREAEPRSHNLTRAKDALYAYSHFRANRTLTELLRVQRRHRIILDTPMEYTPRGGLRVTVLGDVTAIQRAVAEVPGELRMKLEHVGDYVPPADALFSQLTERQQETLRAAVEAGYYEEPRRAGYQEVAERLGVSAGTVGEHLRKIEARILPGILP